MADTPEQVRQQRLQAWSTELAEHRNDVTHLEALVEHPGWRILRRELGAILRYKRDELATKPLVGEQLQQSAILQGYCEGLDMARQAPERFAENWRNAIEVLKREIENVEEE